MSGEATITIPKGCKPSKVCSKDFTRPALCHAYLRKRKDGLWLLATDSYSAVALKVEGTAKEGWIPLAALKQMEAGKPAVQVSNTAWRVTLRDGDVTYDIDGVLPKHGPKARQFPDYDTLADGLIFTGYNGAKREPAPVGFNPTLLSNVGAALGGVLRADILAPMRPIHLCALGREKERVALQMPVRLIA